MSVDMAGDAAALAAVHEQLGDRLKYSMIIGKSHHDSPMAEVSVGPDAGAVLRPDRGQPAARGVGRRGVPAPLLRRARGVRGRLGRWLTVERSTGAPAAASAWADVFAGAVPPSVGRIVSLHD